MCTCSMWCLPLAPVPLAGRFLLLAVLVGVLHLGGLCLAGLFFLVGLVAFFLVFLAGFLFRANLLGAGGLVGELLFLEEGVVEMFLEVLPKNLKI